MRIFQAARHLPRNQASRRTHKPAPDHLRRKRKGHFAGVSANRGAAIAAPVTRLDLAGDNLRERREARFILGVKAIQFRAVDVEHPDQLGIFRQEWHDDFRSRRAMASDMPWKFRYVRDAKS